MSDTLLILHFLGLALGVGTGFANFRLGLATADMPPEERTKFFLRAFALAKNSSWGLVLLIVSGVGLMFSKYGGVHAAFVVGGPAFHAKLTLVLVLVGLFGYMQMLMKRARQAQGGPTMPTIPKIGRITLAVSLGIVITAVLAFH
jgi:uncharacterized membrane protein